MDIGTAPPTDAESAFHQAAKQLIEPRVLELGTLRWDQDHPTHHKAWLPNASEYVMCDIAAGVDVDVVADAHALADRFPPASFDVAILISVLEHLQRPWIAIDQLARVVAPGGLVHVATHQTFPIHGYPSDYFRFTREALVSIFDEADWTTLATSYSYPCEIRPPESVTRWNTLAEAFLNVEGTFRRR